MRDYVVPQNRPSSVRSKELALKNHLLPRFGNMRLDEITSLDFAELVSELRRKNLSPKTTNNIVATLRRSLAVAVEWGLLGAIPKTPHLRVPEAPFRYLTEAESRALLDATLPGFWRTFVLLILHTGLRFCEAGALRWVDLNLTAEHPFVHVCRGGWGGVPGPTKSGRTRDIPLSEPLVIELAGLPRVHDLVFPQQKGREMMTAASKAKYLHKFCRLGGVKPCGWHVLRHTFGTRMAAMGVPIPVLQKLMGHANIKMTMRYVHVDPMSVLASVAAIERAMPVPWHLAGASPNRSPNQGAKSTPPKAA